MSEEMNMAMRFNTHLDKALYLSSLLSDLSMWWQLLMLLKKSKSQNRSLIDRQWLQLPLFRGLTVYIKPGIVALSCVCMALDVRQMASATCYEPRTSTRTASEPGCQKLRLSSKHFHKSTKVWIISSVRVVNSLLKRRKVFMVNCWRCDFNELISRISKRNFIYGLKRPPPTIGIKRGLTNDCLAAKSTLFWG